MNRQQIYELQEGEGSTFEFDNDLPPLPLPKLEDTLQRYFNSLKPFGSENELKNSERIIREFQNGIGRELHKALEIKASKEKNWVEKWWADYAYHSLRVPIYPYTVMAMPLPLKATSTPETHEYCLKSAAKLMNYSLHHWDLLRKEKIRPSRSPDGKITYSSYLLRHFYCTTRIPGETQDRLECHFKTVTEGDCPHHGIIIAKGRIFMVDCLNKDGTILSAQQVLVVLQNIRAIVDYKDVGDCVPVLTSDDRTSWAKNRKYLQELSVRNRDLLKLVESSCMVLTLDENEPSNYSESSQLGIGGDLHSKWADRSSVLVMFKNGTMCCLGEHSAYDGTISISYGLFVLLSLIEQPEPDWNENPDTIPKAMELAFDLDDHMKMEIKRVLKFCDTTKHDVIVSHSVFEPYGKEFMKRSGIHPDAFVQMALQLTYYKIQNELPATYETALMRNYFNGRTETLRVCSTYAADFVKKAVNPKSTKSEIFASFKAATNEHNILMSEARKGNGVDRHLFGLWCIAYERNLEIPELYSDPLYSKSGGGGNFVLSTSSLGYTCQTGYVAPMLLDGYGAFYSITSDHVFVMITSYRNSTKTSAYKFIDVFKKTMIELKNVIEMHVKPKM